MITKEKLDVLVSNFLFRGRHIDLRAEGYIIDLVLKDNEIGCVINVTEENQEIIHPISAELKKIFIELEGVESVKIVFTGDHEPKPEKSKIRIPGVKKVILVSSGKGGVGKSTIAFILAKIMSEKGKKIGLLDADIYGPSVSTLTGISDKPEIVDKQMIPHDYHGIQVNSMGYLIPESKALSWRGPMITKALHQLLYTTKWENLDYLIIDMPPGTGDIHLTICDKYNVDSVIIVSTPQILAVADVSRAIDMYHKFSIPILGIVKNMSYVGNAEEKNYVFGKGEELSVYSKKYGVEILCEVPLDAGLISKYNKLGILTPVIELLL
jgi:ATP-binding protein involved in chromosome partitioning